jgi:hypothetical protein
MEAPAYIPRNLTVPIAAWLRRQGFTAQERERSATADVAAHWLGPQGERFQLDYAWQAGPAPEATCRLTVLYRDAVFPETLFTAQQVRRLRDVRRLLLGCVRYANARLLANLQPAA